MRTSIDSLVYITLSPSHYARVTGSLARLWVEHATDIGYRSLALVTYALSERALGTWRRP